MAQSVAIWIDGERLTERHRYTAYIVFEVALGWSVHWPADEADWAQSKGLKVCYGGKCRPDMGPAWIPSSGLLAGELLTHPGTEMWSDAEGAGVPGAGRLPFGVRNEGSGRTDADWWSWVFWMATRMEERNAPRDAFGRFCAASSMAYREGWLGRPEVECRVRAWAKSLGCNPAPREYTVQATIDVDSAFAYKHRSPMRLAGASVKDVLRADFKRLRARWNVLINGEEDPYDTYDWLEDVHRRHGLRARYFLLLADRGAFDRPVDWQQPGMQALIQRLMKTADVGLHPGVAAHDAADAHKMKEEGRRFERLTGAAVTHTRQHYLLQRFPTSWQRLESLGVAHDHSLGYADAIGFRAGLSRSFRAFDLSRNERMNLVLHPVAAMDATLNRYMHLSPDEALDALEQLAREVKSVEGTLTLLWHNETVAELNEWVGWRAVYEQAFERIC